MNKRSRFMAKAYASGNMGHTQGIIDLIHKRVSTACNNKEMACPKGRCSNCALADIKELTEGLATKTKTAAIKKTKHAVVDLPAAEPSKQTMLGEVKIYNRKRYI